MEKNDMLYYRTYGEGPPLIILHGLYGASDNWVTVARSLSESFKVYVVDQRNHGLSFHSGIHDYNAMQNDLLHLMDDLGIEKAVLLGHSMGGKTVMSFAAAHAERVEAMIVVDIAPVAYHDLSLSSTIAANHAKMMDAMLELDLSAFQSRDEVSKALAQEIGSERVRMFLLKNLSRDENRLFEWKLNLPVLRANLDKIMDGLSVDAIRENGGVKGFPALFIKGERSDYIRAEHYGLIEELFPSSSIVSIPNAGHWVHAEQPALLVKAIKYFLNN